MKLATFALCAVLLCVAAPPVAAFSCISRPAIVIVRQGLGPLPTDAKIFVRTRVEGRDIHLVDKATGTPIKVKLVTNFGPKHILPLKPLAPQRDYELFYKKRRMAGFRTGKTRAPSTTPTFGPAKVTFSRANIPNPRRPPGRRGYRGRSAQIRVEAPPSRTPSVVMVHVVWQPSKGDPVERRLLVPYQPTMEIASIRPCRHTSTPAPVKGRYTIIATGWSVNGFRTKPRTFTGTIP